MIVRVLKWLMLCLFLAIIAFPLLWLVASSFKTNSDFFRHPIGLTVHWTFSNYISVMAEEPMLLYLMNSLLVSVISTLFGAIVALMASYAFLYNFRFKRFYYFFIVFGLFVPTSAFMIPYFLMISRLGLYNTVLGIALVYTGVSLPTGFLVANTYMKEAVNIEVIEASYIDGANMRQTFFWIVAPISMRGVATACVFLLIIGWNELLYALLLSQSETSRTVQVAISFLVATYAANFPQAFSAMVIAVLPIVLLYIFLNKQIVAGLGMTVGLK